jgi:GNAT superfamily N-acetyltransferase
MTAVAAPYPFADLALARRLERTEARANARFVEARARVEPSVGATWIEVAGAYAMFDGIDSPCTQTFGIGLFEPVGHTELEALETFFVQRGAAVHHEVSPIAGSGPLPLLRERGYAPIELTSVLYRPVSRDLRLEGTRPSGIVVRQIDEAEAEAWAAVAAEGWSSEPGAPIEFVRSMGRISTRAEGTCCFLAELDGRPVAAGAFSLGDGVALLAGASTIPPARRQGAQRALLEARLRAAADHGCELAMMGAAPGSASQRNAERQGFRIAYTRVKWQRVP